MNKLILSGALMTLGVANAQTQKPNIIIINADDLGYGDISCNGYSKVLTPNVDKVANQGIRFTNMHCTSSTSTPSRFSMLTGKYAWRVPGTGVAQGDAAMIVTPQMKTMPAMLQRAGYTTAAVGKWHLGLGAEQGKQNWNGKITPALKDIGFNYSFIMAATGDRVPCVYIEDGRVVGLDPSDPIQVSYLKPFDGEPTGKNNPELLKLHPSHGHDHALINGISRIGYMKGGKSALWVDEQIADRITEKAVDFIEQNADKPFFLYFATNDIHVPRAPHERFVGKSGLGARGDAILSFDWSVGEVLNCLEKLGIADNTLIIITSDNGPVIDDGYEDRAAELLGDHKPSAWMRGGKYSIYEAGTRVVGLAKWAGQIKASSVSNAAISQIDLFATLADITGAELAQGEAPDSHVLTKALTGKDKKGRARIIEHSGTHSITVGDWKYIAPNAKGYKIAWETGNETGNDALPQLYNIKKDKGERNNLAQHYPQRTEELAAELAKYMKEYDK